MVAAVKTYVASELAKRDARIAELEARLPLGYAGTWQEGEQASKGFFYADHGSVWYCNEETRTRPGDGKAWQLAVKRGRDAR